MTPALAAAPSGADIYARQADTLRALAEAGPGPSGAGLVARLNPAYPRQATRAALEDLCVAGLVETHPHPLTPLLTAYALTGAGRRWVHHHG